MGKHGDQIQKLFSSPADLFVLQYWAQVSERVRETVTSYADLRSGHQAKRVYYCIIDGKDSDRLALAYPDAFDVSRLSVEQTPLCAMPAGLTIAS